MKISLCPSFYCNFRCGWCYLSTNQLASKRLINLTSLSDTVRYLHLLNPITHIDIYGGEPTLLPSTWSIDLISMLKELCNPHINVITNLSSIQHPLLFLSDTVGISYDFDKREQYKKVRENLRIFPREKHVITLINELHRIEDIESYIEDLTALQIDSWELKPFSVSEYNLAFKENFNLFETFVQTVIEHKPPFVIINEQNLSNPSNSYSNDHIYIMPDNNMYVLDFENNREYFKRIFTFDDFITWTTKEHETYNNHSKCSQCDYNGNCLSEHLKVYDDVCNGFPNLIKWYNGRN